MFTFHDHRPRDVESYLLEVKLIMWVSKPAASETHG